MQPYSDLSSTGLGGQKYHSLVGYLTKLNGLHTDKLAGSVRADSAYLMPHVAPVCICRWKKRNGGIKGWQHASRVPGMGGMGLDGNP